jgi:VanZ family protein
MPAPNSAFPGRIGDRRSDCRVVVRGIAKPPVLSRRTIRLLCLASLAVIVYGTLGPLSGRGRWVVPAEHWQLTPPRVASDLNDVLTNFVVYVPVGIAFRLLVRRRGQAGWADLLLGLGLSVTLSYITEVLQQAMPGRVSSLTDVAVNGLAALTGGLCAVPVQRLLRRAHAFVFVQVRDPRRLWAVLACATLLATAVLMTMPWDLTRPHAALGVAEGLGRADGQRFGMFVLVGFFLAGALLMRKRNRRAAVLSAWLVGVLAAVVLEVSQLVLYGHLCSVLHAVVSVAGVSAGCVVAAALVRPARTAVLAGGAVTRRLRVVAMVALLATIVYAGAGGFWREAAVAGLRAEPAVDWVPLRAHFHASFRVLVTDLLDQLATYSFLTLLCLLLALQRGPAIALLLLAGLVGAAECSRALVPGHHADTTAPLLAVTAWLLTTRIWQSIQPRMQSLGGQVAGEERRLG